jgi:hypothetical protein
VKRRGFSNGLEGRMTTEGNGNGLSQVGELPCRDKNMKACTRAKKDIQDRKIKLYEGEKEKKE